ncbi:MAG: hypothetical protein PWP51_2550 [Clostridiales bacterium]|jgi:hypothetical protein|nr:hypothetical protein [Clostridiales bacterium]MDN5299997.1 hypothetical protein [Clostridiales bacterium]
MAIDKQYKSDVEAILSHRHDHGADFWTTPDKRLIKGAPFSTLESITYLLELGMAPTEPLLEETTKLIFSTWQEDGRFKLYPKGAVYPCHTINAAATLCKLGYANDIRLQKHFSTYWRLSIEMVDGAAINSVLVVDRKLNFPIHYRPLRRWMHFAIRIILITNPLWTRL